MNKRVEQLLNGIFEYDIKAPILSVDEISASCKPGDILTGSFAVSGAQGTLKGFLYSSSPRVIFDPMQINAEQTQITYQFDSTGLTGDDTVDGQITLCTDCGEVALPYHFRVSVPQTQPESEVTSTKALAELAQKDTEEARRILFSPSYQAYVKYHDPASFLLYQSVVRAEEGSRSLEEYLIGSGMKEPIELSLDEQHVRITASLPSESRTIRLIRSSWGYLEIHLDSDAEFLRVERRKITTDDFVGDSFELEYIIDRSFLHKGKNFARLTIGTSYQTLCLEVEVDCALMLPEQMRQSRVQKIMQAKLLDLYIDLRRKRIEMQVWIDRSMNVISSYRRSGGHNIFADLFMVQLYYADGKRVKGYRMLQELGKTISRLKDEDAYGFYLYLTTFFEREVSYVDDVERRIRKMFSRRPHSWILQWILLYLDEEYLKDDEKKLEAIRQQTTYGCASPIMYLEAAAIYQRNPYLLRTLDLFARKILLYAVKQDMLTEELASHVGNLALQGETFEPKLFSILKSCYAVNQSPDCLRAICSVLIKADCCDHKYFQWYALAVQSDVRVAGLYEYYMETMDNVGIEKMPQIIRMYFSYDSHLNYHKKAAIYRDISDNRDNVPQVYRQSRAAIEHFITEQLAMGHIDRDLAVLYERFIVRKMLTSSLTDQLLRLLFTFEVSCKNPRMKAVVVIHPQLKSEQHLPIINGQARVQIYSQEARILLLDEEGNRYASTSLYLAERYLDSPLLITYCREVLPSHPSLTLYLTGKKEPVTQATLPYYQQAETWEELTDEFRAFCRRQLIAYYRDNPLAEDVYAWLKSIRYRDYIRDTGKTVIELLAREGLFEEAASLLDTYGSETLDAQCLVQVCSQSVLLREYEEEETLVAYCWQCYDKGKYDDNILTYLLMYYDGPIDQMKRLWRTGKNNDMDTLTLEEKILSLLEFTRYGAQNTEEIYVSYRRALGKRKLCQAYVNLQCYEYLVKERMVSALIFDEVEKAIRSRLEVEDVCQLALLHYYADMTHLSDDQERLASQLLSFYALKGIRLGFYRRFPQRLRLLSQVDDRSFVEYRANPVHTVVLHYRKASEEDFHQEEMKNSFEGIFVREFILFAGEEIVYYVVESADGQLVKKSDEQILSSAMPENEEDSRYGLLYRMSQEELSGDQDSLKTDLDNYRQLDALTESLFTLI